MTSNDEMRNDLATDLAAIWDSQNVEGCVRTRFAPSPNGLLHQGHALSAYYNKAFARQYDGQFMLRIEDIDAARSRTEYIEAIAQDMEWLGLSWDETIIYQSANIARYQEALEKLQAKGLLYQCICTRSDIAEAVKLRPVKHGPDGPHYPGTCRDREIDDDKPHCWRLNMHEALRDVPTLYWSDMEQGEQMADPSLLGDVVLWRKDAPASYHLAATCDDAADHISHVIRGMDLLAYTGLHRLLQHLLDLPTPQYWHHQLLSDDAGEKLSKSRKSQSLKSLRAVGIDPQDIMDACKNNHMFICNSA